MGEAWIIDGVRTPRGRGKQNGSLHPIHPQELLAQVLQSLQARVGFDPAEVDDVVVGNASNDGDHGADIARLAVLVAGWPVETPGVTLNRFCGSGQQAVTFAAMGILSGHQHLVIGGGVESMSRFGARRPTLDGDNPALRERYPVVPQGISADLIATQERFGREDVDAYAVESQRRAGLAAEEGRFDRSVIAVHHPDGSLALDHDEQPRPGTNLDDLSRLEPAFGKLGADVLPGYEQSFDDMALSVYPELEGIDHVHHAGNSSQVSDGASAMLLASPEWARAHGVAPRARLVMSAVAGAEPVIMLTAPAPASRACLERAGMTTDDVDIYEINEAFASVALKVVRDLDLDPAVVNVNGGAIALGHPIGATGPMLMQTALDELERRDASTALVAMCTGGGMATASIIERI